MTFKCKDKTSSLIARNTNTALTCHIHTSHAEDKGVEKTASGEQECEFDPDCCCPSFAVWFKANPTSLWSSEQTSTQVGWNTLP
jgi:hypothetical protein